MGPTRSGWTGSGPGPQAPDRTAGVVLAERLAAVTVDFPGDHQGFLTHSPQFAESLHKVLSAGL